MPDYQALSEFRYQLRRFTHFSEVHALNAGIEPQQHQLLLAVKGASTPDQPAIQWLAERLQLRHHSVVGLVDRLEARYLVKRRKDPDDHRRVIVDLTPAGDALLAQLSQFHEEELREMAPALIAALGAIAGTPEAPLEEAGLSA
jgi:DNA-binding MarR family transcriptional regulator